MIALLPLLLQLVPSLATLVAGGKMGGVLEAATKVAKDVFGTDDPEEVKAKLDDPAMAEVFKAQIEAETAQLQAQLADVANARAMEVSMVQAASPIAWAPVVISGLVILLVTGIIGAVGAGKLADNSLVVGAGLTWMGSVLQYWIGSSSGSRRMGDTVREMATRGASVGQTVGRIAAAVVRAR